MMSPRSITALLAVAAVAAVAFPLLVYSTTLALFGLAHALVELRVLDVRYRRALGGAGLGVALALGVVFAVRCAATVHWIPRDVAHVIELGAGFAAVLVLIPRSLRRGHGSVAIGTAAALGLGVAIAPLPTLLVLAVLHNLAPWPLVAATATPDARPGIWRRGAIVFVLVPLAIATGLPFTLLASLDAVAPEATVLPTGPLFDHFSAFWGPPALDHPRAALHVFAACAYLQCAHYVFVLGVLPGAAPPAMRVRGVVVLAVVAVGALAVLAYAVDFAAARAWYGTIAGVHAWAEFPALLLALDAFTGEPSRRPSGQPRAAIRHRP